jgi:hypothetical protein
LKDSVQREHSLQSFKKNNAFAADVVRPIQLQGKLTKTSGGPGRRLDTAECSENSDGSRTCRSDDNPGEGLDTVFKCPVSAETTTECDSCVVYETDSGDQCNDCDPCGGEYDFFAYDCSNILPDDVECTIQDCNGDCLNSPTPTDSTPTDSTPTDPPTDDTTDPPTDGGTMTCSDNADGTKTCRVDDPPEDFEIEFECPANAEHLKDCFTCVISYNNGGQCNDCTVCGSDSDIAGYSFDCTNFFPDEECAIKDCDLVCQNSPDAAPTNPAPTPTEEPSPAPPTPTEGPDTEPWTSTLGSASVTERGMLSVSATAIAAFSLF